MKNENQEHIANSFIRQGVLKIDEEGSRSAQSRESEKRETHGRIEKIAP